MSWKPIAWLLILITMTALFILVFEPVGQPAARILPVDSPLLHLDAGSVTRLSFQMNQQNIECVKRGGQWFLLKPIEMRADTAMIRRVIDAVITLRKRETIDPDRREKRNLTLASFGLEVPRARLVIGNAQRMDEILLGDAAPFGDMIYVRMNTSVDVVGVTGKGTELLNVTWEDLVDHAVFPAGVKGAVRIEVKQPGGFFQLVLRDGAWRVQQPFDGPADGIKVERMLGTLASLQMSCLSNETASLESSTYGFTTDEAAFHVSIWREGASDPFVLTVGKASQADSSQLYARISDVARICLIKRESLAFLNMKPESLRDRRIVASDLSKMASISLREGDQKTLMVKTTSGSWVIVEPLRYPANTRAIGSLLRILSGLQGDEVSTLSGTNAMEGAVENMPCRVVLSYGALPMLESNVVGVAREVGTNLTYRFSVPREDRENLVYCDETKSCYRVNAYDLKRLWGGMEGQVEASLASPLPYMDRRILDFGQQQIRRITIVRQNREETVTVDADGVWTVESPPDGQIIDGAIPQLLEMTTRLQADRIESITSTNAAAYGLDESAMRVSFGLSGGGIQKTILFGRDDSGREGVFCMVQGQDAIFVVSRKMTEAMTRPLVRLP